MGAWSRVQVLAWGWMCPASGGGWPEAAGSCRTRLRPNQPKTPSASAWSLGAQHPPPHVQCVSLLIEPPHFPPLGFFQQQLLPGRFIKGGGVNACVSTSCVWSSPPSLALSLTLWPTRGSAEPGEKCLSWTSRRRGQMPVQGRVPRDGTWLVSARNESETCWAAY